MEWFKYTEKFSGWNMFINCIPYECCCCWWNSHILKLNIFCNWKAHSNESTLKMKTRSFAIGVMELPKCNVRHVVVVAGKIEYNWIVTFAKIQFAYNLSFCLFQFGVSWPLHRNPLLTIEMHDNINHPNDKLNSYERSEPLEKYVRTSDSEAMITILIVFLSIYFRSIFVILLLIVTCELKSIFFCYKKKMIEMTNEDHHISNLTSKCSCGFSNDFTWNCSKHLAQIMDDFPCK